MIKITDPKAESYLFFYIKYKVYGSKSKPMLKDVSLTFQIQLFPIQKEKKSTRFQCVYTGRCKAADFLRTVTAASDLIDCTLVNCVFLLYG